MMVQEKCMLDLYKKCCSNLSAFEIWDGYYTIRYEEFKKFCQIFPKKYFSNTLEIGCGIGYQAGFLSCISNKVTASDVDYGDMIKHSRGLTIAQSFVKQSGIKNIEVVNANAENLPFADEQFDFIYCSYSFQYILNKNKALKEIRRVLKKDGYFFCVLPTTIYGIKTALKYYTNIIQKSPQIISTFFTKNKIEETENKITIKVKKHSKLLPQPDDDNNTFLSELYLYSTMRWQRLFTENHHQIILKKYTSFDSAKKGSGFLSNFKERFTSDGIILITKK